MVGVTTIAALAAVVAAAPEVVAGPKFEHRPSSLVYLPESYLMYVEDQTDKLYTSDNGGRLWDAVELPPVRHLWQDPTDKQTLYALLDDAIALYNGESWDSITLPKDLSIPAPAGDGQYGQTALQYGGDSSTFILNGDEKSYLYRNNQFESLPDHSFCVFGDHNATLCWMPKDSTKVLGLSDDRASWEYVKVNGDTVEQVQGLVGAPGSFYVALVDRTRLMTSPDLIKWQFASFGEQTMVPPHSRIKVMESSRDSLHLTIQTEDDRAEFWTSNSKGSFFTKRLDNVVVSDGFAEIQRAQLEPGVMLANVLGSKKSRVETRISHDDGRTWQPLKAGKDKTAKDLHLHSMMGHNSDGHRLSSAPGIIAGIGNVGSHLGHMHDSRLFICRDGETWEQAAIDEPVSYTSVGGGAIMVAFPIKHNNKFYYSQDRGVTWASAEVPHHAIKHVVPAPDVPQVFGISKDHEPVYFNFASEFSGVCEDADMDVVVRGCSMGRELAYVKPKDGLKCWIDRASPAGFDAIESPSASFATSPSGPFLGPQCDCSEQDFECDEGFTRDKNQKCVPGRALAMRLGSCQSGSTMHISSGYLRIPGNVCKLGPTTPFEGMMDYDCDNQKYVPLGGVTTRTELFNGDVSVRGYTTLRSDDAREDETVLVETSAGELHISQDQGGTWTTFDKSPVSRVWVNPFFENQVIVSAQGEYMSLDRAKTFAPLKIPAPLEMFGRPFNFHPTEKDWMIATVLPDCDDPFKFCEATAYVTTDAGKTWRELAKDVTKCFFAGQFDAATPKELVYCEIRGSHFTQRLVSSSDWFKTSTEHFNQTFGAALDPPFLVAAVTLEVPDGTLKPVHPMISNDGVTFVEGRLPAELEVDEKTGYTVIETKTKSIFMQVSTSIRSGSQFGDLVKSDSYGSNFVISLQNVNMDELGYVDFTKVKSLEGVALANVVDSPDSVSRGQTRKQLKSMITHSDGALWDYLPAPEGECKGSSRSKCSLHLHGYTERGDARNTPYSPSAVGVLLGNGNVGEFLSEIRDSATYMSRDAGISWFKVSDTPSFWEFGDSGSVIITIPRYGVTDTVRYTLNEGKDWTEFKFSDKLVRVITIATLPSDTSRKFVVFAEAPAEEGHATLAIQLDFSGLSERQCEFKGPDNNGDDFELWIPEHPQTKDKCLFGHVAEYYRKIPDRNCFVGKVGKTLGEPIRIVKDCKCTRRDFECDYNYINGADDTCQLVDGRKALTQDEQCANNAIAWHEVSGYRKIPIDTCVGGEVLDAGPDRPCPGKEKEFEERYGNREPHSPIDGDSGGPSFFRIVFSLIFTFVVVGVLVVLLSNKFQGSGHGGIRLGDFEASTAPVENALDKVLGGLAMAGQQVLHAWNLVLGKVDSRLGGSNRINLYQRIDDDERSRILDSDFEDNDLDLDLEDNPEINASDLDSPSD